ncbi:MAG: Mannosyl-glycoprotein endo-beta-N-acetylglucosaminidase [Actinomycetia bacterium]|nr:Mannosyl-glycoprotein endo-beta-N-acetylglucosaminidase [Actinomycetes bacterium]
MPIDLEMFGFTRARVAVVALVAASVFAPGVAYGATTTTSAPPASSTTTTTKPVGGPSIPTPGESSTTTVPSAGPTTTTTIPPPPAAMPAFTLPTNSGLQLLQTMQQAKLDLKAAQDALGSAKTGVAKAHKADAAARRQLKKLEGIASETRRHLDETRTLLRHAAVEAYIHAGNAQLMNAISGFLNTTSVVEAGSQLHVLGSFGTNQKNLLDDFIALKQRVDGQVAYIQGVSDRAAATVRNANKRLDDLRTTIADARTRIAVSLAGIHDFQTAATSATSPILGPSRLSAKQMADYVKAQHYTTHITVPIEVLAQIYIDEGARTGVRGDVAFAQSILETGGFANPGSAADNNNFAGIGWCDSCKHGFDFPDAKTGVRAQLQLLRVYVDPLFPDSTYKDAILLPGTLTLGFRGKVQTWWDLWGTWATGALYGQRVYDIYQKMVDFSLLDPDPTPADGAVPPKPALGKPALTAARKP